MQDRSGAILMCNERTSQILGLSRDELVGRTTLDPHWRAVHRDGSQFLGSQHPSQVSLRTGLPNHDTIMGIERPDGTRRWLSVNAVPIFRPSEAGPYAVVTSFHDVTELHRKIDQVRTSEARFRAIFAAEPECVALIDRNLRLLEINPAGLQLMEADDLAQAQAVDLVELILPEHREPFRAVVAEVFRGGMGRQELQFVGLRGTPRWVEQYAVGLPDVEHSGTTDIMLVVARDVTERKQSDEQLHALRNQLAHASRLGVMGEMATGLAHELNQPLAAIHLDAVAAERLVIGDPSGAKDVLKRLGAQALRAGEIVRRLRTFVRRNVGKREIVDVRATHSRRASACRT
ncbi:MAG: PAS domain S-box protein [Pirellulales bacterium]